MQIGKRTIIRWAQIRFMKMNERRIVVFGDGHRMAIKRVE